MLETLAMEKKAMEKKAMKKKATTVGLKVGLHVARLIEGTAVGMLVDGLKVA
jgi:hypothetical protein